MPDQPPEDDEGNREYKLKIIPQDECEWEQRCIKLATQLKYRLGEGCGKALYLLGVRDKGQAVGIDKLSLLITITMIEEAVQHIEETTINNIRLYRGTNGHIATMRLSNPRLAEVW